MILDTKEFQLACKKILFAIDSKDTSLITETLELKAEGNRLSMNVTNREYYVRVEFALKSEENFLASVNASLFLKLISKVTTSTITIEKSDTSIVIKANGTYKLPIIFNGDKMLELPTIDINNVTNTMNINSNILHSIVNHNSKELLRATPARTVQKYYYVDEHGAITFTQGACVNEFELEKPVKLLLSDKVVKLFKLFQEDTNVSFTLGQDALTEDLVQTKVRFDTPSISIISKLSDSNLISSVPSTIIRNAASKTYDYSIVVSKTELLDALNRIILFGGEDSIGLFSFSSTEMTISNDTNDSTEVVSFKNECNNLTSYEMKLNLGKFKIVLDGADDDYVTINFGDKKQVVVKKQNIYNITPER